MVAKNSHSHLNALSLQRTDELIRISQQERNLVIAKNMYATGLAIHIDIGSKNADYIKERLSVALHGIFTHIQDVLVIYFHKAMCKYITLTDTLRNSSQRLYQVNIFLIVCRNFHTVIGRCRNGNSISLSDCASGIDIQFHRSRLLFARLDSGSSTVRQAQLIGGIHFIACSILLIVSLQNVFVHFEGHRNILLCSFAQFKIEMSGSNLVAKNRNRSKFTCTGGRLYIAIHAIHSIQLVTVAGVDDNIIFTTGEAYSCTCKSHCQQA